MAEDHTHPKATDNLKLNTLQDGFVVGTDRIECCIGVAGWVTYLQKEREPLLAVGLATSPRTTRRALRRHKVMLRGRTASEAAGTTVDYSDTVGFNARMGLELTGDSQLLLLLVCSVKSASAARPAAGLLSGMKIEPKCVIVYA